MVAASANLSRVVGGAQAQRVDAPGDGAAALPADGPRLEKRLPGARPLPLRRVPVQPIRPNLIEPNWVLMAPIIGAAALTNGIATMTLPHFYAVLGWVTALLIAASTPWLIRFERGRNLTATWHNTVSAFLTALPMFLIGLSVALWTDATQAHWRDAVGTLVMIGAMASIILKRRAHSIITAHVALWTGVALIAGNRGIWFGLTIGAAIGLITAIRQAHADERDARRQRQREHNQLRAEEILSDYEQTGQGWFWETDRRGLLVYVSPTIGEVLRMPQGRLLGRPLTELFDPTEQGLDGERSLAFHLTARSPFLDLTLRAASRSEERWWSVSGRPIYDSSGNYLGFRGSGNDLTEKLRSEEQVSRLAHYDSLTGLANRVQMARTLEQILTSPNSEGRTCAVFLLDLDRFKQVNDTMGHPAGDNLLTQVAERLENAVDQYGRVGRLGGDEFQVILPGYHCREELAALAQRIIAELSEPYSVENHRIVIGASIGIALSPDDGLTSEAIIRNADLALYAAKDSGRGRHHFYAADLHSDAEERRQLEQDLRDALTSGGFELYYQPVVHTVTERITGFEALLRWNHPTRGWLPPSKFIPVAEDSGLIAQIGEWALRTACADLANWPEPVRVAVNVSPLQFANPSLPAIITQALAAAQVNPARLELEITESVFLNDDEGIEAVFAALKRVGVRLALDDFGTGYSALGYLKKAPFDKIKIDQSFVRGATVDGSRNGAIISSIVSLAEALGMETTAEGVETLDELDLVRSLGCSHVQGHIYDQPLDRETATARLQTGPTAAATGPRTSRAVRHSVLRNVDLVHGSRTYSGTIRNISATGAMVEGLWNVPPGTDFTIAMGDGHRLRATTRWCQDDRMGMEFAQPLAVDSMGRVALIWGHGADRPPANREIWEQDAAV